MLVYQKIAQLLNAHSTCVDLNNTEWIEKHNDSIEFICDNILPSGSGIDSGVKFNFDESNPNKLVFNTSFHHMDEYGYYDGWTDHKLILKPSLAFGYNLKITGYNKNEIKDYLSDVFSSYFDMPISSDLKLI